MSSQSGPDAVEQWVEALAHREDGLEAFDELAYAAALVERAVDIPGARVYAGPCDVCGKDLYAEPGAAHVSCRPCGIQLDMEIRRGWLLKTAEDRLEGAATCARVLTGFGERVTPELIRQWAKRKVITPRVMDPNGQPLYRVGDVRDAIQRSQRKQKRHA